jgi:hypothetical protein
MSIDYTCISIHLVTCIQTTHKHTCFIRDRPFNLQGGYGFLFRSEIFFRTTHELEYLFFFVALSANFFPEFNIRLYDKNSESDFFSSTKIRIFFSATLGIRIFYLEKKNHTPPPALEVKWSIPKMVYNYSQACPCGHLY